jgi:hypothetical protein
MNKVIIIDLITGEPSLFSGIQDFSRFERVKHCTVDIENFLQVSIHFRVTEESLSKMVVHDSKE